MKQILTILSILILLTCSQLWGQAPETNCSSTFDSISNRKVYTLVDSKPEFLGGRDSLDVFLLKNIKYPETTRSIDGKVNVSFIVEPNGKLSYLTVKSENHHFMDEEVLDIFNKMPNWTPGNCNGQPVPVWVTIPVSFRMLR